MSETMNETSNETMIVRHEKPGIFIHWFNAACWLFLLVTGLALIKNPELQPLGQSYPDAIRAFFGGGGNLLYAHIGVGLAWAYVWLIFLAAGWVRYVVPFISGMVNVEMPRDAYWMVKKQLQMVLGHKMMGKIVKPLGLNPVIPDQDYYNVGQKAAAVPIVLGALVLLATGLIMAGSSLWLDASDAALIQWSIFIHFLAAGFTFAILLIHIYMASIAKDERPAFWSMFTGSVPVAYAKHHHRLWYDRLVRTKAAKQEYQEFRLANEKH